MVSGQHCCRLFPLWWGRAAAVAPTKGYSRRAIEVASWNRKLMMPPCHQIKCPHTDHVLLFSCWFGGTLAVGPKRSRRNVDPSSHVCTVRSAENDVVKNLCSEIKEAFCCPSENEDEEPRMLWVQVSVDRTGRFPEKPDQKFPHSFTATNH